MNDEDANTAQNFTSVRSGDDDPYEEDEVEEEQDARESAPPRFRRQNSEAERIIHEVLDPDEATYSFDDSDLKPYTSYNYRIRTTTRAGSVEAAVGSAGP